MRRFVWLAVVIALVGAVFGDEVVMPKNLPLKVEGSNLVENVMPTLQHHPKFPKAKKSLTTLEYPDCIVDTVGFTYYDMQHNHTIGRNIAVDRAGGVHIAWMRAPDASFTHRHIYYNYITPAGNVIAPASSPIRAEGSSYAGYCTIALAHLPPMFDTTATEIEVPFIAFHAIYSDLPDPHTDVVWDLTYRAGGEGSRGGFAGSESGSPLPIAGSGSLPPIAYSNSNQYDDLIPELEECSDSIDIQAIWPVVETGNDGWVYLASTNSQDTNHVCGTEINQWIVFWSGQPDEYDEDGRITYYHFGSPLLLDFQNGINVDLAYDPNHGKLAAVYYFYDYLAEPYCTDTLAWGQYYDQIGIYYRTTTDNGVTWSERIPILEYEDYPTEDQLFPYYNAYVGYAVDSVTEETTWVAGVDTTWTALAPFGIGALSAVYDDEGVLHVVFESYLFVYDSLGEYSSDPCHPAVYLGNAICYWNSRDREIIPVSEFIYANPSGIMQTDSRYISAFRHSLDPSISVDNEGNLYIAWEQTFNKQYDFYTSEEFYNWVIAHAGTLTAEELAEYDSILTAKLMIVEDGDTAFMDVSDDGVANEDIYVSMSIDGGRSWGKGYNITQSFSPGCAAGECESELNVSMAERVDDALHIFAVLDLDAGENLREVGERTNNPIIYIKLPKETATFDTIATRARRAAGIKEARTSKPTKLAIGAYPNPFNATANIVWSSPVSGNGKVEIVDVTGKVVATLYNGFISTGQHSILWDGTDDSGNPVPSGTYMCRVILGNEIATSKITLLK